MLLANTRLQCGTQRGIIEPIRCPFHFVYSTTRETFSSRTRMETVYSFALQVLRNFQYSGQPPGTDPFGTGTKLARIRLVFTWDLVDPVRIGSAIWY